MQRLVISLIRNTCDHVMYLAYELPPRPVSAVHRDEELCSEVAENGSVISLVTWSGPEREPRLVTGGDCEVRHAVAVSRTSCDNPHGLRGTDKRVTLVLTVRRK